MAFPVVGVGLAILGVFGVGWAAKEGGEAMDSTAKALKWATVAGGVYISYQALKSAGAIK
ncbi:hypothetical protein [uncultured Celeribacter sp.]|uniref:hypothetical protein n=1 Tax=uncultured Celeribacter sp. TaxID=1303376 RepID=UPI002AA5E5F8|nr:hypothetical protein [uncultured Celeribacter sp.]